MADKLQPDFSTLPPEVIAQILIYASSNSWSHGFYLNPKFLLHFMKEERLRNQICLFYPEPEELLKEAYYDSSISVCAELIQIHGMKIVPSYFKDNLLEFAVKHNSKNLFKLVCKNPQWELEYEELKKAIKLEKELELEDKKLYYFAIEREKYERGWCYVETRFGFRMFRDNEKYTILKEQLKDQHNYVDQAKPKTNGQRTENKYKLQANRRASKKGWLNYNS